MTTSKETTWLLIIPTLRHVGGPFRGAAMWFFRAYFLSASEKSSLDGLHGNAADCGAQMMTQTEHCRNLFTLSLKTILERRVWLGTKCQLFVQGEVPKYLRRPNPKGQGQIRTLR